MKSVKNPFFSTSEGKSEPCVLFVKPHLSQQPKMRKEHLTAVICGAHKTWMSVTILPRLHKSCASYNTHAGKLCAKALRLNWDPMRFSHSSSSHGIKLLF
jgi:hypothetical protein